jgi:hypothetical protein
MSLESVDKRWRRGASSPRSTSPVRGAARRSRSPEGSNLTAAVDFFADFETPEVERSSRTRSRSVASVDRKKKRWTSPKPQMDAERRRHRSPKPQMEVERRRKKMGMEVDVERRARRSKKSPRRHWMTTSPRLGSPAMESVERRSRGARSPRMEVEAVEARKRKKRGGRRKSASPPTLMGSLFL